MNQIITDIPKAATSLLVKNVMNTLNKHYPEHAWMISADDIGGVVNIFLPHCSLQDGYTLHIADLATNDEPIWRAGGELLERFKMTAGKLNVQQAAEIERNPLDGSAIFYDE